MSVRQVAVVGPESAGKTTLAQRLAAGFGTVWVPEFARSFYDRKGVVYEPSDLLPIVQGQLEAHADALGRARNLLFSDTDLLTTCLWSDVLYGSCPAEARAAAAAQSWDLTLLLAPDVPWEADPQRVHADPQAREAFFQEIRRRLEDSGRRFVEIRGGWEARWQQADGAVRALLEGRTGAA